jgi:DUF1365 family protein
MRSCVYVGSVVHERLRPKRHRLSYRVFSLLLDLSEIDRLASGLRLFSRARFNLFSFHDRDHGERGGGAIEAHVRRLLAEGGIDTGGGPIRLLAYPRVLGYVFNPLSVYFCYDAQERLCATLYEVSNTFGERHSYLIGAETDGQAVAQSVEKQLYVSPFNSMAGDYRFRLRPPHEDVTVGILYRDGDGPLLKAHFHGHRRPLTDATLARLALTHPAMTLKVTAGIHLEALRLWLKRVPLQSRPPAPRFAATLPAKTPHE